MSRSMLAIAALLVASAPIAKAHHGYDEFLRDKTVTIHGTLTEFRYENPHVIMQVRADDAFTYTVVWNSASQLRQRAALTDTTFSVGDEVLVTGSPSRDASARTLSLITEVRRLRDGWRWLAGSRPATAR